ncbi:sugar ABC transporter permease [Metabacillus sp. SLBN-84]
MKKTWLSVLLSIIFPGLGHFYLGMFAQGVLLVGLAIVLSLLNEFVSVLFIFLFLIVWIYGLVSSVKSTKKVNKSIA